MIKYCFQLLLILTTASSIAFAQDKPVKIAIAGMTHGHVGWILKRPTVALGRMQETRRSMGCCDC